MNIEYSKDALKFLARTDKPTRERIITAVDGLTANPPAGDIKTMQGYDDDRKRLRVGKYRIIYKDSADVIQIVGIGSRGDIYNH